MHFFVCISALRWDGVVRYVLNVQSPAFDLAHTLAWVVAFALLPLAGGVAILATGNVSHPRASDTNLGLYFRAPRSYCESIHNARVEAWFRSP